jgi:hypothetical protein
MKYLNTFLLLVTFGSIMLTAYYSYIAYAAFMTFNEQVTLKVKVLESRNQSLENVNKQLEITRNYLTICQEGKILILQNCIELDKIGFPKKGGGYQTFEQWIIEK